MGYMKHKGIQKLNTWSILFVISLLIEVLLLSFLKNRLGIYISPFVIVFNNFALVFFAYKLKTEQKSLSFINNGNKNKFLYIGYAFLVLILGVFLNSVFHSIPITPEISDVIPTLQKYNTRLLSGEFPYNPIQYSSWVVIPNYLPMQWLPFSIAEILNLDYRWIAYILFVVVNFLYWKQNISKSSLVENVFKASVPFLFVFLILQKDNLVFGTNVELMLAAFYMFLAYTIKSKNYILIALGILFCLMSRFSLIFWLPLYVFLLFKRENFKFIFKVGFAVFVGVLIIYVIPFMSQDPFIFIKGLKYYSHAAVGEWLIKSFQTEGDIPFHLGQGVGFAVYFYEFAKGTLEENLNFAKSFHVFISLFTVLSLFLFYWFKKNLLAISFFALLSFKIYLSVFYAFIHIPYVYLQLVPLFISVAILYEINLFSFKTNQE